MATNGNKKQTNTETVIAQHLDMMEELGRKAKEGFTAKQTAIELFQADCTAELVSVSNVDRYVDRYCKGASITGNARSAFASALKAFGDPKVIKAWPTFSAALNKMHASDDAAVKKLVSRTTTGKDKFGQLYKIANAIKDSTSTPLVNEAWIAKTVAPKQRDADEVAKLARKAISDSVKALWPVKPTKAQKEARDNFFKLFAIELPA